MTQNKIAALYVRVSTKYQEDKDSIPHQIKELKAYCKHVLHLENIEVFEDAGRSGKNTDRPAFQRMLKKIKSGHVSHVVVYKIDRISRNLVDFSIMYDDFKKNRVTFVSLNEQFDTSSAMGEAMLKIILVFAELERKMTSERVTDIMLDRATNGLWNGANVPYGYKWDEVNKFPVPDEVEAPRVQKMFDLYDEIQSSCKIRDMLNSDDVPTKRGGEWSSKTVADIIRNPFYKGTYRYNYRDSPHGKIKPPEEWIVIEDNHKGIISPDQWDRCNKRMDKNAAARNRPGSQSKQKNVHVFGRLLYCSVCGSAMLGDKDRRRENGFYPSNYRCGNYYRKNTCRPPYATEVRIGPFLFNYISNMVKASNSRSKIGSIEELEKILLNGPEFDNIMGLANDSLTATFSALRGRSSSSLVYKPTNANKTSDLGHYDEVSELKNKIVRLDRALDRLKKAYLFSDDAMDEKEYLESKLTLETEKISIKNKIAEMEEETFEDTGTEMAFVSSASSFLLANKINSWDHIVYSEFAATIDDQVLQDFARLIFERIEISNGRVASIHFRSGLHHVFIYKE